jgi:hypothetical protein
MEMIGGTWIVYICGGLFVLFFGGLGIFLIVHSQVNKRKAQLSRNWPVAKGIITEAKIHMTENDDDQVKYFPTVRYTYQVGGQAYEGKLINFGSAREFNSHQKAAEYLAEFPIDTEVNVFYNPEKPGEAVLKQRAVNTTVGLVIGIVILAITLCLVCLMSMGIFRLISDTAQLSF